MARAKKRTKKKATKRRAKKAPRRKAKKAAKRKPTRRKATKATRRSGQKKRTVGLVAVHKCGDKWAWKVVLPATRENPTTVTVSGLADTKSAAMKAGTAQLSRNLKRSGQKVVRHAGRCPPGHLKVHRKAYRRSDGTRVPATTYCTIDRGKPGRGKKVIKITDPGDLGGPGYLEKSTATRHRLLDACVRRKGYRSCLGKIEAISVFLKNTGTAKQKATLVADRRYLVKKYGGPGSFGPRRAGQSVLGRTTLRGQIRKDATRR